MFMKLAELEMELVGSADLTIKPSKPSIEPVWGLVWYGTGLNRSVWLVSSRTSLGVAAWGFNLQNQKVKLIKT